MIQNMALNDSNKLSHKNSCFTSCNHENNKSELCKRQKLKVPRLFFLKVTNSNYVKGILNVSASGILSFDMFDIFTCTQNMFCLKTIRDKTCHIVTHLYQGESHDLLLWN